MPLSPQPPRTKPSLQCQDEKWRGAVSKPVAMLHSKDTPSHGQRHEGKRPSFTSFFWVSWQTTPVALEWVAETLYAMQQPAQPWSDILNNSPGKQDALEKEALSRTVGAGKVSSSCADPQERKHMTPVYPRWFILMQEK